jgi:hypothetical protein
MGYGEHKFSMSASKAATAYGMEAEKGTVPFRKAGPEYPRLRVLMEARGTEMQSYSLALLYSEDPWFERFKLNSIKSNMSFIKKVSSQREYVETKRKYTMSAGAVNSNKLFYRYHRRTCSRRGQETSRSHIQALTRDSTDACSGQETCCGNAECYCEPGCRPVCRG